MTDPADNARNPASLAGARIWLSGAVPETEDATEVQRAQLDFVSRFSALVFRQGGHIVHGGHPSFIPSLLEEARRFQADGGHKDCLALVVSRYWSKDTKNVPIDEWRDAAMVYELPEAAGERARSDSLEQLRKWVISRCEAIVIVGGEWWQSGGGRIGVALELELALERGIPAFLLGGLGGAAREFAAHNPEVFALLKNGLDPMTNRVFAMQDDIGRLADTVCQQLERLPLVIRGRGKSFPTVGGLVKSAR